MCDALVFPNVICCFQDHMTVGRHADAVWVCYGGKMKVKGLKGLYRCCIGCGHKVPITTAQRALHHADHCKSLHSRGLWSRPPVLDRVVITTGDDVRRQLDKAVGRFFYVFLRFTFIVRLVRICQCESSMEWPTLFLNACFCRLSPCSWHTQEQRQTWAHRDLCFMLCSLGAVSKKWQFLDLLVSIFNFCQGGAGGPRAGARIWSSRRSVD